MPSYYYRLVDPTNYYSPQMLGIPGIRAFRQGYRVPENAVHIAERILEEAPHTTEQLFAWENTPLIENVRHLRGWVPDFLTAYQAEGIELAHRKGSLMLVHPTGSGKTLTGIVWALIEKGPVVIVTKAAVRKQYAREVQRFTDIDPTVLEGHEQPDELGQFIIVGWENLSAHIDSLVALRPRSVVFDEIHKGKAHSRWRLVHDEAGKQSFEAKQNQAQAANRLSRAAHRRLGTTATPIRNRLRDLWAQLDLLLPGEFGSFWAFARRYCALTKNSYGGWDANGTSNLDELRARLGFVMHVVPQHVVSRQLPPKRRTVIRVSAADQNAPGAFASEIRGAVKRGRVSLLEVRLAEAASRKRKYLVDMVGDSLGAGQKVCIFTGRRMDAEKIGAALAKEWPQVALWVGHGEYSQDEREIMRDAYMASPGPSVLVATGDSFGEGLNLQDTDVAVFAMLPYTAGQIVQWEGRFSRLGGTRAVNVVYLIAEGTVDEHVAQIILSKLGAVESVAGGEALEGLYEQLRGDSDLLIKGLTNVILGVKTDLSDDGF